MKCWRDHCKHKLEFLCTCTDPPIYLCDSHIEEHLKIHTNSQNFPEQIIIIPNPIAKRKLINHLHKSISHLYKSKQKIVKDLSAQIMQLNKQMEITLKSFDKAIKEQRNMIIKFLSAEIISNPNQNILDASNLRIEEQNPKEESNQNEFFRDNSQKIVRINLSNYSSSEFHLPLDSPKSMFISMCSMPENSIFCYGDYPNSTDSVFIIESDNTIRKVKNAPHK
ncbi:unnamed protein product [Blepharisma stoltei]|uniref:C2H2-type domain-containing protein n=1 Tax=Blepharisma stoltei TaxID=1481888 RepID=A0AAU9K3C4_9CILI|nr:unnamed protein product [Blepharisma stoltei]